MATEALVSRPNGHGLVGAEIERVLLGGDLSKLTPEQRLSYYNQMCQSLGLNPLTKPFEYIQLNGKLQLYARKDATDQLRKLNGVSVDTLTHDFKPELDLYIVTANGSIGERKDTGTGAVSTANLKGDALANAIMKAETKAKRRLTLSICGLGMLDESELDTIRGAIQPEESMPEDWLMEKFEWIANCKDLEELGNIYRAAYKEAAGKRDQKAMLALIDAKDKRKALLQ